MKRYETFTLNDLVDIVYDTAKYDREFCHSERIADKYKDKNGDCLGRCRLCIKAWLLEEMDDDYKDKSGLTEEE